MFIETVIDTFKNFAFSVRLKVNLM